MNNVMLHVHEAAIRGDAASFICDMQTAFPYFYHAALHINNFEDPGTLQALNACGVRVLHAPLSEAVIETLDPGFIVFHDVSGKSVAGWPERDWLQRRPTISLHYKAVPSTIPCDLHLFATERMKASYNNLIKSGFIKRWKLLPPKQAPNYPATIRAALADDLLRLALNIPDQKAKEPPISEPLRYPTWRTDGPVLPRGVLVGCGSEQEWMLEWWWKNYSKHNFLPVLFIDMGMDDKAMTPKARAWCESKGRVETLRLPLEGWFQKPFALIKTVFEESLWTDVDCEIRGSLEPAFAFCKNGLAAAKDPYYHGKTTVSVNSGVVAFKFGSEVVSEWCSTVIREGKKHHDDQIILDTLFERGRADTVFLPRKFNWLRLDGDINPEAVCVHWTGSRGKEIVKAKIEGRYLREHFIADLANTLRWKSGLEIGTWKGRTFLHLLKTCPQLTMTTVDLWEPQPENQGPEKYTLEEGERWDHKKNEEHVRSEAAVFGARAVIYKGRSQEVVPSLKETFDFVFVDGDHGSEAVAADIRNALVRLKPNGYLIGHDIDWPGVRMVVERLFPGYMVGPDNLWFVKTPWGGTLGPMGCPMGAVGINGPTGPKE